VPTVLVCPDAFKGTWRAAQVAAAVARGLERAGLPPDAIDRCPIADGGEGTMDVLLTALGGETRGATVSDPLGRPIAAGFALLDDGGTAIVEVAQASGLHLGEGRAEEANTYGTGELIAAAAATGAQAVLVAAGGSATTDGGAGAIAAIGQAGGLRGAALVVLCDVSTPFEGAARIFGPQKGADEQAVERLTSRLKGMALALPRNPIGVPMTGAAGGLAGGLWAAFGAHLEPGAAFVLDALDFDARLKVASAVITGEGCLDAMSLDGKAVGEVLGRAQRADADVHAIVGRNLLGAPWAREASTLDEIEAAAAALGL
jgi:glycerate kinase